MKVVRADVPQGYKIIYKDDFDPEKHTLYEPVEPEAPKRRGRQPKD